MPVQAQAPKMQIVIRDAGVADARSIAGIGAATFQTCFGHSMPVGDLQSYLATTYSVERITLDMEDEKARFFVAVAVPDTVVGGGDGNGDGNGEEPSGSAEKIVGFVQMKRGSVEECLPRDTPLLELHRIYVANTSFGGGAGGKLMAHALSWAKSQSVEVNGELKRAAGVWLGVWEENFRAQKFYARYGYERIGKHGFTMGETTQDDFILLKMFD